jgi:hypothetical protein
MGLCELVRNDDIDDYELGAGFNGLDRSVGL